MKWTPQQKKEASQSALCAAFGTAITVLILEFFHIPNSYMALSFGFTLSLLPRMPLSHTLTRIMALSLGIVTSMLFLVAFSETPWFFIPLAGTIPALGYAFFLKRSGPGSAYAFGAYFLAFHVLMTTSHFSGHFFIQALKLWSQSMIAILVAYLVTALIKEEKTTPLHAPIDVSSMISIGLTVCIAVLLSNVIKQGEEAVRLVIASISGIATLELEKSTTNFLQRALGYCLGAVLATAFIVAVVALGNNIALYLLAIGAIFGLLEWIASLFKKQATLYRAMASMIAFSVLMIPAPDRHFNIAYGRITSSLLGFALSIVVFLVVRECSKATEYFLKKDFS
ncbi:MAG: FUSC family protein [Chthoniobacterales bacterium]|nr:FUSC family protein [Chthoniobacterales bacterium]